MQQPAKHERDFTLSSMKINSYLLSLTLGFVSYNWVNHFTENELFFWEEKYSFKFKYTKIKLKFVETELFVFFLERKPSRIFHLSIFIYLILFSISFVRIPLSYLVYLWNDACHSNRAQSRPACYHQEEEEKREKEDACSFLFHNRVVWTELLKNKSCFFGLISAMFLWNIYL